jgi:hypothetical protein
LAAILETSGPQASRDHPGISERTELTTACAAVVIGGPVELGSEPAASTLLEWAATVLRRLQPDSWPVVEVCRLWLVCALDQAPDDAADQFARLAAEPLAEPVQALAYRALAYFGRRRTLAQLLPAKGPLSLAQADAWLEAAREGETRLDWLSRVGATPASLLGSEARNQWLNLFLAETRLAGEGLPKASWSSLAAPAAQAQAQPPRNYAEAMSRRLASRAAAALSRAQLANGASDGGVLANPAGRLLPAWEQHYLQGLFQWRSGDEARARLELEAALQQSPGQTPVRLALAVCLAGKDPETALGLLEHPNPTREMLVTQAMLLARLGRYAEAGEALARCHEPGPAASEPVRYSWALGRQQCRRQEKLLATALAERRREWATASQEWQQADWSEPQRMLREARGCWAAQRELGELAPGHYDRRVVLEQRLTSSGQAVRRASLSGTALFFRALALCAAQPERAVGDFLALLQQRAWVEAEQRVGGGRLICVGDQLLRLGEVAEAARAYELARIKAFVAEAGTDWVSRCPAELPARARKLLAGLCDEGQWAGARAVAERLAGTGEPWAEELADLVRIRHGLALALRGELEAADRELSKFGP